MTYTLDLPISNQGTLTANSDQGDPFSKIYVFGDSLSDPGNIYNVTQSLQPYEQSLGQDIPVTPPSPPYFDGRFTNGSLWVENLAADLGITLTPSTQLSVLSPDQTTSSPITLADGNVAVSPFFNGNTTNQSVNFAFGGATTGENGIGDLGTLIPGVQQQVDWFVNDHQQVNKTADSNALYVIWAGANDYTTNPDADPETTVENIETEIESLYDIGARNFLVPNLPDLGKIPDARSPDASVFPETLTDLTDEHNGLLNTTIDELRDTLTGAEFAEVDINSLFDDISARPQEYGLTNVTDSFLDPITFAPTVGANPDDYLFWDGTHPTEKGHQLVEDFALETLNSQLDSWAI
ncbi:MAG: SGNH/GDSL hydrolase family protein [Waterburya sp.]